MRETLQELNRKEEKSILAFITIQSIKLAVIGCWFVGLVVLFTEPGIFSQSFNAKISYLTIVSSFGVIITIIYLEVYYEYIDTVLTKEIDKDTRNMATGECKESLSKKPRKREMLKEAINHFNSLVKEKNRKSKVLFVLSHVFPISLFGLGVYFLLTPMKEVTEKVMIVIQENINIFSVIIITGEPANSVLNEMMVLSSLVFIVMLLSFLLLFKANSLFREKIELEEKIRDYKELIEE